jgi:hypothetical protein
LNTEVISSNKAVITQLITVLERKKQDMNNILATVYPTGNNNKQLDLFNDITNFEEVLRLYNTAVEMYLGLKAPNMTQQTKLEMLGNMKKIAPPLNYIVSGIRQKIQFYHHHNRDAGQRQQIGKLFARYTDAYSCYSIILNQTQTGELHQISRSDLEASIKTAISQVQEIRDVFTTHNLQSSFTAQGGDPYFGALSLPQIQQIVYGPQGQPAQQFIPAPVANHAVPVPQVIQQQALDQQGQPIEIRRQKRSETNSSSL